MKIYRFVFTVIICLSSAVVIAGYVHADTIITGDGKEIKGIVVEDYMDRVVFSTADGEITLMKSDIRQLVFDNEEDNLIKLGELAAERGDYSRAAGYYDMALKVKPDSAAAKQGMAYIRGNLFRKEESVKAADIKRQQDLELYGPQGYAALRDTDKAGDLTGKLERSTGTKIAIVNNSPKIVSVKPDSRSYEAGLRRGDILVSVWGRLTGYLSLEEILDLLINRSAIEIRCVIERKFDVIINPDKTIISGLEDLIGASFAMGIDGLAIASVKDEGSASTSGLQTGDLVTAIDGNSTRYMSLKKAIELVKNSNRGTVRVTIRRNAIIWRTKEL